MVCKFCGHECKKDGHQSNSVQRYECKHCHKKQQSEYRYNAYAVDLNGKIITYTKEGLGIRSMSRILRISISTLLKRILSIAKRIVRPIIPLGRIYEVDEIQSFVRQKKKSDLDCIRLRPRI